MRMRVNEGGQSHVSLSYMWSSLVRNISTFLFAEAQTQNGCLCQFMLESTAAQCHVGCFWCLFWWWWCWVCSKKKSITVCMKIWSSTTVFNIDNYQKCFLSSKSVYYNDFWRSCDTEDWSNDAENSALITEINYILLCIHIEKLF